MAPPQRIGHEPEIIVAVKPARGHRPELDEFSQFYQEHLGYVRHVVAHLGVPHAVDDVVQETFVTAFRRFASLRPDASARAWLAGIARRTAYRWRRTLLRGLRRTHALRAVAHAVPPDPGRSLDAARFLERFLASLDADKREVFVMAEVAQLAAPEIAHTLGLNPNTVYTRLRASRRLLEAAAEVEGLHSAGAALTQARDVPQPTPSQMRAGWLMLLPQLGHPALSAVGLSAALAGWVGRPALRWAATLGFAGIVATGVAGSGHAEDPPRPPRAPSLTAGAERLAERLRSGSTPHLVQPWVPAVGTSVEPPVRRGPPVHRGPASIASETALLERAVAELPDQPRLALELARQHAREYPRSQLSEVRAAVEVRALCRLGKKDLAHASAARFMQQHRTSNIAQTVAQGCEATSAP